MRTVQRLTYALALISAAACGGAAPDAKTAGRQAAPPPEPMPTSTAWLYVTGSVGGGRDKECARVLDAVRSEEKCQRGLCKYAEELANDWLSVCAKKSPAAKPGVEDLVKQFSEVSAPTEHPCEVEARRLIRQGCPEDETCAETGQAWVTKCSTHASPLILQMLTVRIERATGEHVELDARTCDSLAQNIDEALACNDVVKCESLQEPTAAFADRCTRDDGRMPMASALRVLGARAALRQAAEPIPLSDTLLLEAPGRYLPLSNGRGAVVRVGWSSPTSYEEYVEALAASEGEDVLVARVFLDDQGHSTLRLGRFSLDEGETLATHFPSLTVEGEDRKQEGELLAVVRNHLGRAASATSNQQTVSHVLSALVEAAPYLASSTVLQQEFSKRDAELTQAFRWIGQQKGEKLSSIWQRNVLIPALRRSRSLLAADIDEDGAVAIGELTPAAAVELRTLMPKCAAAYDEGLSYLEKAIANTQLTAEQEKELTAGVTGQVEQCSQALDKLQNTEQSLLVCSFGEGACDEDTRETTLVKLDETKEWLRQAQLNAKVAVAMLPDPARKSTAQALRDRCLDN